MKIFKNQGQFKILTPLAELKKQLVRIERAGRTCYRSEAQEINLKTAKKFTKMILMRGHESVIEHSNLTVEFSNISRGFTHELVRHRLCAFSQESTRYVDYSKADIDLDRFELKFIVPPHRDEKEKIKLEDGREISLKEMLREYERFYRGLRKANWQPEDARQILPIATKAQIVVSANLREWRHIFRMRTSKYAHWEIRQVMGDLLLELKKNLPIIFDDFIQTGIDKKGVPYFEQNPEFFRKKLIKNRKK